MTTFRKNIKNLLETLQLPRAAREARRRDRAGLFAGDPGPERVIAAGIEWLGRAQDCSLSRDGGVARHFSVINGWSHSYPETTGYIIATLIEHARITEDQVSLERAVKMLDWILTIQFESGGFQGGTVNQLPRVAVTFNTGQILIGLSSAAHLDDRYRVAMKKAGDWLVSTQDADGCWRAHATPFAAPGEKTYETHVSLGLFQAHMVDPERGYQAAGVKQVDWALKNQIANGWLSKCCLTDANAPLTHTIGYALKGIVGAYQSTREQRFLSAARRTADGLLTAFRNDGGLPGRLDSNWNPTVDWVCLTGSCQISEVLFLLFRETGCEEYRRVAKSANQFVRRSIALGGPEDTAGGVKGSFPIDGHYGRWQYLNWACKFMIDANRAELSCA